MTYFVIILVVIVILVGVSLALGRTTREAQSVRDDEFVELENSWIRYRVAGDGPPVLLVHGILTSSGIWDSLASRLSERFTVYRLDLRGFGESDKPLSGYGIRHGSRLLHAFCQHFGLGKVAVVGHDIGGDMVVKLAADHPDLVRSVTVVAAPANEEQIDLPTPLWLATLPVIGPLFYALGQYAGFVRGMWMKPFVSKKEDLPREVIDVAAESTPAAVRSTFNTAGREISGERISRQSRNLKAPMLVVSGEEDQIVDPAAAEVWSRTASRSEVALLENCGHLPMIEAPEEFDVRLMTFLTGDEHHLSKIRHRPAPEEEEPLADEANSYEDRSYEERSHEERSHEEPAGIDGMEPDPEASAAEPGAQEPVSGRHGSPGYRPPRRYSGGRRESSGEDLIPELPDDLFRWSGSSEGRRGSRGRSAEDQQEDHDPREERDSGRENGR